MARHGTNDSVRLTDRKRAREMAPPPLSPPRQVTMAPTPMAPTPRLRTGYMHFASFTRPEVVAQHPHRGGQWVTAEIGRMWKTMDEQERAPWQQVAEFERVSVQQHQPQARVETPTATSGNCNKPERELLPSKRAKPGSEPRQPDTPYSCFWKYERPQVVGQFPHLSAPNVSKEVGLRWQALPEQDRQEWKDLAARDRQRYEKEMAAHRKTTPVAWPTHQTSTQPTTAATPSLPRREPRLPKTGFQFFLSHHRESLSLLNMTKHELRTEMGILWQRMSHADRQRWLAMAEQDRVRYENEKTAAALPSTSGPLDGSTQRLEQLKQTAMRLVDGPNLPRNAQDFFMDAKRHELQTAKPQLKHNEVLRQATAAWKTMDSYAKLPFIGLEQLEVDRFVREMEAAMRMDNNNKEEGEEEEDFVWDDQEELLYPDSAVERATIKTESEQGRHQQQHDVAMALPARRPSRKAKPVTPKKPLNAYNMMHMAKREELMNVYQLSHNDCSALCGRLWRQMTEDERQPYYAMAAQDKARYASEMKHLKQPQPSKIESKSKKGKREKVVKPAASTTITQHDGDGDHRHDQGQNDPTGDFEGHMTAGYRYYIESKRGDREQWTWSMWMEDWQSMAPQHRALWEELAGAADDVAVPTTAMGTNLLSDDSMFRRRYHATALDLDALCGLMSSDGM